MWTGHGHRHEQSPRCDATRGMYNTEQLGIGDVVAWWYRCIYASLREASILEAVEAVEAVQPKENGKGGWGWDW